MNASHASICPASAKPALPEQRPERPCLWASLPLAAAIVLGAVAAGAQPANPAVNFDDRPTGFLSAQTGGMPADAWNGTTLATAKRLVSALPAAPRSRALRDLQFRVLVSELKPPAADGSP